MRGSLALALLFVQAVALVHLVIVRHVRCPEHGDAMHDTAHEVALPLLLALDDTLAGRLPDAEHDDHDHCRLLVERRLHEIVAPQMSAPTLVAACPTATLRRELVAPSVELLHLAPKASPPR